MNIVVTATYSPASECHARSGVVKIDRRVRAADINLCARIVWDKATRVGLLTLSGGTVSHVLVGMKVDSLFARPFCEFFSSSDNTIISTLVLYFRGAVRVQDHIDYRFHVGYGLGRI